MSVVRSWGRALVGASGVIVLVPVGLIAAVALAAAIGGADGLGPVGQLIGGPQLPPAQGTATVPATRTHDTGPAVPVGGDRPGPRGVRAGARSGSSPVAGGAGSGSRSARPSHRRISVAGQGGKPGRGAPVPATPSHTTPTPTPAPKKETNVVRRVGKALENTVRPVPLVGPVAADAVGTVIDLVVPPSASGSSTTSGPRAAPPVVEQVTTAVTDTLGTP